MAARGRRGGGALSLSPAVAVAVVLGLVLMLCGLHRADGAVAAGGLDRGRDPDHAGRGDSRPRWLTHVARRRSLAMDGIEGRER